MPSRPPNLLFIFSDQQRPDTLGCTGNTAVATPHLDALAESGLLFDRCYCTEPICTPSRASLLTGRWPHALGVAENDIRLPDEERTIAELLPAAYARRSYNGKWHLGDEIATQHGFTHWTSISDGYRDGYKNPALFTKFSDYYHYLKGLGMEPEYEFCGAKTFRVTRTARLPFDQTKPLFQARAAAQFIRESGDTPFVSYVSYIEPHRPYFAPPEFTPDPASIPVGPEFCRAVPKDASVSKLALEASFRKRGTIDGESLLTEEGCRRLRARYLGMCTLIDRSVGEILAALDETGQRENTIIVYTSDHGDMVGDNGLWGKNCMYDASCSVPLIINAPGLKPGRISNPVSHIDLLPTLFELMGVPPAATFQGISRLGEWSGGSPADNGDVFVEFEGLDGYPKPGPDSAVPAEWHSRLGGACRTIVTRDGWKLNAASLDRWELFNLRDDPTELRNLVDEPKHRPIAHALLARIRNWQKRTGDTAVLKAST